MGNYMRIIAVCVVGLACVRASFAQQPADRPELVLNTGHAAPVYALTYSPAGDLIASAGADRTIKLWNARTGAVQSTLTGHEGAVTALAFGGEDGTTLASASTDGRIRLWNPATGRRLQTFAPPAVPGMAPDLALTAIAVWPGPAETLAASAFADGSVAIWRAKPEATTLVSRLPPDAVDSRPEGERGKPRSVRALAFSRDGKMLAAGAEDGTVLLYDAATGSLKQRLKGHAMPIVTVAFSSEGGRVIDGSADGIATIWSTVTGKKLSQVQMHAPGDAVSAAAVSDDGSLIVTGGGTAQGDFAMLWDGRRYERKAILLGHERPVLAAAFSPDGRQFATTGRDYTIRLWNAETGAPLQALGGTDQVLGVAASPRARYVATASGDGRVRLWNRATGALERVLTGHAGPVRSVAYSADGRWLASGGADKTVRLWDVEAARPAATLSGAAGPVNSVAFSADGTRVAAGAGNGLADGVVYLWDAASKKLVKTLTATGRTDRVNAVALSPDGTRLAAGSGYYVTGQLRLWDLTGDKTVAEAITPMPINAVAFSPDGKTLVAGSALRGSGNVVQRTGDELRVLDGSSGLLQKVLTASSPGADILGVAFLDGENPAVASASRDGVVRVWDLRAGGTIALPSGHRGEATSASLLTGAGGTLVVTGGRDNTVRFWSPAAPALRATLVPLAPKTGAADDDTAWVALTPEGFYDAAPGSARRLAWRVGPDLFPVEAYENDLRHPDAVSRALAGQPVPETDASRQFAGGESVPPRVEFLTPREGDRLGGADRALVKVEVTDETKIDRIEIAANGRLIAAKPIEVGAKPIDPTKIGSRTTDDGGKPIVVGAKPIVIGAKTIEVGAKPIEIGAKPIEVGAKPVPLRHRQSQEFSAEVPLPAGDAPVTISAVAFDRNGMAAREEIRLQRGGSVVKETGGKLYVLAVGVSAYKTPALNLKYARSDAEAFAALWPKRGGALYREVIVKTLADTQATSAGVRAALFKLLESATETDTVALFLSGHGIEVNPGSGEYFFATHEIEPKTAERIRETALPWTALQTTLAQVKARRVLLFLDACHSGSTLGTGSAGQTANAERMGELLAKRAGVLVFSSSRGSEFSYELDELKHGAFTAALVEAIDGGKGDLAIGAAGRDGIVTAEEMLAYLRVRVPQLTDDRQTPTCPLLRDFGDAYPIARLGVQ